MSTPFFQLHHHFQRCQGCGHEESWSHIYIAEGKDAGLKLTPMQAPIPTASPIEVVRIPGRPVPVCAACVPADSATAGANARAAWEETLRRKRLDGHTQPRPVAPSRPKTTVSDLA